MVRRNAKRDVDPTPYPASEGPPRPMTIRRNAATLIANVPASAMTRRSPELGGNFWLNDNPWIQPRIHTGLNENRLLPISTNKGKPFIHMDRIAQRTLADGSLGFQCLPWKTVVTLVVLHQTAFPH